MCKIKSEELDLSIECHEIKWQIVKCSWIIKPTYICFELKILKYVITECKNFVNEYKLFTVTS